MHSAGSNKKQKQIQNELYTGSSPDLSSVCITAMYTIL